MVTKLVINIVANKLIKHFKLDKIMAYVFEDNELDERTKNHEDRIKILETMAHPKKEFVSCKKCKQTIKEESNGKK
jgi:nicotinic acid mononucleotide adenylyltransferase